MVVVEVVFWVAVGLLLYTHLAYPLVLAGLARLTRRPPAPRATELPSVSLIVAAHDEEDVIEAKVRGEDVITTEEEAPPKVVNLMDALRKSLDQVGKGKKKPAKAAATAKRTKVAKFPKRKGA